MKWIRRPAARTPFRCSARWLATLPPFRPTPCQPPAQRASSTDQRWRFSRRACACRNNCHWKTSSTRQRSANGMRAWKISIWTVSARSAIEFTRTNISKLFTGLHCDGRRVCFSLSFQAYSHKCTNPAHNGPTRQSFEYIGICTTYHRLSAPDSDFTSFET